MEFPNQGRGPAVSVVISTYNCRPWLAEALEALAAQTLPAAYLEILVVDDGSTDGTWTYLRTLADQRPNVTVFRQPHTGGPSAGRNRALEHATGTFVFFHDADDYLAPDALYRLVGAAAHNNADVVAGQVSWVNRSRPIARPLRTVADADLLADGVWRSLTPHKLVRRRLIEQLGLRFPEDMVQGEDQVFMAACMFAATKVSLVADRPCYYRRIRPDGTNLSRQPQTLANKALTCSRMASLVVANTPPGQRRDDLLRRVFVRTLAPALHRPFLAATPQARSAFLDQMQREVLPHLPPAVLAVATDKQRLRLLTARVGTEADLLELNRRLAASMSCDADEVPTYDLGPRLNRLLSLDERRAGAPALPAPPVLRAVERSGRWLTLRISVAADGYPTAALHLAAQLRGGSTVVDLGPSLSRVGSILAFRVDLNRLHRAAEAPGGRNAAGPGREWILIVQALSQRDTAAASPVAGSTALCDPTRPLRDRPWGRIQLRLAQTPRGSVVLSLTAPTAPIPIRPGHRLSA